MARIETGYGIEGYRAVFNGKAVETVDCNYINWTSNEAYHTFANSTNLKQVTNLSQNITSLYSTFYNCTNFTTLDAFPSSTTQLIDTFNGCTSLKTLPEIPNTVVTLRNTFRSCTNMVSAPVIPSSVTTLSFAFAECTNLRRASEPGVNAVNMVGTFINCASLTAVGKLSDALMDMTSTFQNCTNLSSAPAIPNLVLNMPSTFKGCANLVSVSNIPNSVVNMQSTFQDCTSLVNAPTIPNSVNTLSDTFMGCLRLKNIPALPNSITDLSRTYRACIDLEDMPLIPTSVRNLPETFSGCTNLTNVQSIPSSVINMYGTFFGCTGITNDLIITSQNITNAINCFNGTSALKDVYIPFTYDNRVNTATYNAFIAAGYKEDGSVNGVRLRDLSIANVTIIQSPADATVTFNVPGYSATDNHITVKKGTRVDYKVEHYGYNPIEGVVIPETDQEVTVTLSKDDFSCTIVPYPSDALVALTVGSTVHQGHTITAPYESVVHYKVEHPNYFPQEGDLDLLANIIEEVTLIKTHYNVTINPTPSNATVLLEVFTDKELAIDLYAWSNGQFYTNTDEAGANIRFFNAKHKEIPVTSLPGIPAIIAMSKVTCTGSTIRVDFMYKVGDTWVSNSRVYGRNTEYDILHYIYTRDPNYVQSGHTIVAPYMGNVHWKVSRDGYDTREGEYTEIAANITENIILIDPNSEIYINSNTPVTKTWTVPKDGIYQIIAVGAGGGGAAQGDQYKYKSSAAGGGSGGYINGYYKLDAGTVIIYRIGAGGAGTGSQGWGNNGLWGADGESTYMQIQNGTILFTAGGGTGGYVKFTGNSNPIRESGKGGIISDTHNYLKILDSINGNDGGTSTNIGNLAAGGSPVYSNYGIGGNATATGHNKGDGRNGTSGYLFVTLIANNPVFESDSAGSSEQVVIKYPGKYALILVGAGGGGAHGWNMAMGRRNAPGGSGGMITGTLELSVGTYQATIGQGGSGKSGHGYQYAGNGTASTFKGNIAGGGEGGVAFKNVGKGGSCTVISSGLTGSNGIDGSTESRYATYGAGGAAKQQGQGGYIRIEWVGA